MGNFERELEKHNIKLSDIEVSNKLFDKLQEAIDTMHMNGYYGDLEVILNSNLLICQNTPNKIDTIFGMKVSFQDLEECVSFVVKPYEKTRCWLCEQIENGTYDNKTSNGTTALKFYKGKDGYIISACGEDVVEQDIVYCPICGKKLGE